MTLTPSPAATKPCAVGKSAASTTKSGVNPAAAQAASTASLQAPGSGTESTQRSPAQLGEVEHLPVGQRVPGGQHGRVGLVEQRLQVDVRVAVVVEPGDDGQRHVGPALGD